MTSERDGEMSFSSQQQQFLLVFGSSFSVLFWKPILLWTRGGKSLYFFPYDRLLLQLLRKEDQACHGLLGFDLELLHLPVGQLVSFFVGFDER